MLKVILIILGVIFILSNIKSILIIALQALITFAAYCIHPLLGAFVGFAYIIDWIKPEKKEEPKQEQKQQYQQEKQKQEQKQQYQQRPKQQTRTNTSYFTGCTTKDQLKKRHRELCKKYHPDRGGNEEIFKKMQAEYERLMKCNL